MRPPIARQPSFQPGSLERRAISRTSSGGSAEGPTEARRPGPRAAFILAFGALALLCSCASEDTPAAAAGGPSDAASEGPPATDARVLSDAASESTREVADVHSAAGERPRHGSSGTSPSSAPTLAAPLALVLPPPQEIEEERALRLPVGASGGRSAPRIYLEGLPPGALWDEAEGVFRFVPDFTQGGHAWRVRVTADDGATKLSGTFDVRALDTIRPPAPVVVSAEPGDGFTRLLVEQRTDAFLDSPGHAGRTFRAVVGVPTSPSAELPVRVRLHGLGGSAWREGWRGEYRIAPEDPHATYWWGYAEQLPARAEGPARDYTARRVLHLLAWVLDNHPSASRERVYLEGDSMGATGAMTIGLLHARHFCHVRASFGQAIPRNHRPSRLAQLAGHWGPPAADGAAWDAGDLTRVLRDVVQARDQLLTLKYSKDDPLIHFGAALHRSPRTGLSLFDALQHFAVGHHVAWDEGGHLAADPVLGDGWWTSGWDPVFDTTALVRRGLAFPAFARASSDGNPGSGAGNGRRAWDPEAGYSGQLAVPGDTGWDGDLAGGLNRFLRWDATRLVDELERFELPLRSLAGPGGPPPRPGYPTTGDRYDGPWPVRVDVTPRRVQAFRLRAGERVRWSFGSQEGVATADERGALTVPRLELGPAWSTLRLTREPDGP